MNVRHVCQDIISTTAGVLNSVHPDFIQMSNISPVESVPKPALSAAHLIHAQYVRIAKFLKMANVLRKNRVLQPRLTVSIVYLHPNVTNASRGITCRMASVWKTAQGHFTKIPSLEFAQIAPITVKIVTVSKSALNVKTPIICMKESAMKIALQEPS